MYREKTILFASWDSGIQPGFLVYFPFTDPARRFYYFRTGGDGGLGVFTN